MAGLKVQRNSYVSCAQGSIHGMNYLSNRVFFFIFHYESDRETKKKKRIKEAHFCSILLDISRTFNALYALYYFIKLLSRSFAQVEDIKISKSKVSISFVPRKKEKQEESSIGLHFGLIDFK